MITAMSRLYCDLCGFLRTAYNRYLKFRNFLAAHYRQSSNFQALTALLMVGSLFCFIVVMGSSYFYMFPSFEELVETDANGDSNSSKSSDSLGKKCNVFDGEWVVDESYPLYNASDCPFIERGFDCLANGRKDKEYLKWRWKPTNCEIPRFDVQAVLKFLRGKRVVFVGDSLSRSQWESMVCMLMSGVEDKRFVYEVNGNVITKQIRHLSVRFDSFGFMVEFYRSVFLVQSVPAPKHSPKRVKTVLKLDRVDDVSREWIDSDVLIFNSGHWWTPTKLFDMGWYFQNGGKMKLRMPISNGFKIALSTWKSWLERAVNPNRTRVFFRTFESTHWSSGSRKNCKVTRQPSRKVKGKQRNSISNAIINAVKNVSVPVQLLHVTPMCSFRSDGHVGPWGDDPSIADCSHWCLPGIPDTWNELLFSFLLSR